MPTHMVARMLGLADHGWTNDYHGGGSQAAAILGDAAMVVAAGLAETVVVYRSLNGRSGKRMGQISLGSSDGMEEQFLTPTAFAGRSTCSRWRRSATSTIAGWRRTRSARWWCGSAPRRSPIPRRCCAIR
ncbi:hypothetical protein ACFSTI_13850 [Rhizorhabdus histidinilytica]